MIGTSTALVPEHCAQNSHGLTQTSPKNEPNASPALSQLQPALSSFGKTMKTRASAACAWPRSFPAAPGSQDSVPGKQSILVSRTAKSAPSVRCVPRPVLASGPGSPQELDDLNFPGVPPAWNSLEFKQNLALGHRVKLS